MRPVLALDLGTHTGWGVHAAGSIVSGVQDFSPRRFDGGGMRYLRFRRWLEEVWTDLGCSVEIYFEEVRFNRGAAGVVYDGLVATLTAWCEEHDLPYQGVPVGTIKKHATGKGNSSKEAMVEAARARGWHPKDDNEADALWLLDYAVRILKAGS